MEWNNLPFGYRKTNYNVRCSFKNNSWGAVEVSDSEMINLHMAATCLHYGQEAFEGLKAFRGKDDRIRVFRWRDNAKRLISSAKGILMAEPPEELFKEMVWKVVGLNKEFVPPYDSGAALYIRPLLIGTGPEIGVKATTEYLLMIFVTPVGPYFKGGIKPVDLIICRDHDRAAPLGTGNIKVGGNYAGSLAAIKHAHDNNYANIVFLDAKEKKYIDECGPANFFGIKDNTYVTPESKSILPSITNKSLMRLAEDMGLRVERRKVPVEELGTFEEVGACGTAAVISPISKIYDPESNKTYNYTDTEPGPVSLKLYNKLRGIQLGDEPDDHNWVEFID